MDAPFAVAIWLFALTHIDTFVVLVAFCADEKYRSVEVLVGHYLGSAIGFVGAVLAAFFATEILRESAFLLGVIPLVLGIIELRRRRPKEGSPDVLETSSGPERIGIVTSAGIGLSGENVAVYVPFFIVLGDISVVLAVVTMYLLAAGVVFLLAFFVARRTVLATPAWVDRWFVPAVLVTVGVYVLVAGWLSV